MFHYDEYRMNHNLPIVMLGQNRKRGETKYHGLIL